ncbi:ABC transporter substrate-binding protein [Promicromonospora sukumoe]|uniref:ABC transporter substrate-binding protein n=1 Tax=Promicromonospora sukumoe TaxID=88382 RepID=UPI0037C88C24
MRSAARFHGALAAAAVMVGALSACGGASDGGSGGGPEEVTFWGSWSGAQAKQLQAQADAFNESQDEYEVTYVGQELVEEKLLTALASGSVPDVVLWDRYNTPLYVPKNALAPLDEYIAADGVDTAQFYEQAMGELVVEGETYGLPLLVDNRSLFYNTELLADAGVEPPTDWDSLKKAAEAVTGQDGGKLSVAGFALDDPGLFNIWLRQAGGQMFSDDGATTAFNSPEGLEVLEFWQGLLDAGVYEPGFGEGVDSFAEGSTAIKYDGPWALTALDEAEVDYGIVQPPVGPDGGQGAGMGGFGLVIPSGAQNPDGAWEFMKWWTTQPANGVDFAKISGWIPANVEAANDPYFTDDDRYQAFIETMEYAQVRSNIPGASDVEGKALIPALEKFLGGETDAATALKEAQELGDRILADNAQ